MTIHELLQAAGLTANDEIPIWDVDGTGEPTKKITAQQLAAAVVALANLVTGVKGNAESSYRTGNVNITPANIGAKAVQSAVSDPTASGTAVAFIDSLSQNAQGVISPTKKTVQSASQSAAGLMSAADKTKLDGIEAGAQVNSVTGVKGNAESSYRTGDVNITPANIGAVAKTGDTMTGPLNIRGVLLSYDLELKPPVGAGIGGFIDFTYNGEDIDNTSRIIEGQRGVLNINGIPFDRANPVIGVPYGGTGATDPAGVRANLDVPSTTGSGASGTWGINVSGGANALAPTGFHVVGAEGALSYYSSDDNFYGRSGWAHYIIANHGDAVNYYNYVLALPFGGKPQYKRQTGSQSAQSPWYEFLTTESPVLVTEGGTGATTAVGARQNFFPDDLSNESVAYMAGFTTGWVKGGWLQLPLPLSYGGTGATDAPGARTNLGIATTVTTVTTTGITSHGNWVSDLNPNNVVIDAAYCTAGTVAVTPYCNSGGKWAFHCIDVSTGAEYGTAFDLTIRYHNIY